uniref:Ig-like domain-containing protein n=1 Tax=Sciurus vulgaris TaxID=55149 RepID=A0A8D2CLF9_SCIVU
MGRVLFLLSWLLPQVWGNSEVLGRSFLFRCLQISSFANSSWWRTDGLAWLGELQTHRWSNASDKIDSVKPWAQGTFSSQQCDQLQYIFRGYRNSFTRDVQEFAKMLSLEYPIELQLSAGCEVYPGNVSEKFFHIAYQGDYILSFHGTAWEPAPQAPPRLDSVIKVLNQDQGTRETVQWLLSDICPQLVNGILETGKSELEKQVKPEAWLSRGLSPGPDHLLLVCHVSGFYPQPVWVMWMRGEQEQQGTQRGDFLPNADGTWYLQATLDVAAGEAAGLACRVKHSSLGGQDLVLFWDGSHTSVGLIILAVLTCLVSLFMFILALIWIRKRRSYEDIL